MAEAFICDAARTPIGRYGGALAHVRPDNLLAGVLRALHHRNAGVDWSQLDDVIIGCANQAGEDNRNVARMAALLGGLGEAAPGTTVNRLCGSGMDAVAMAARAIKAGEAELIVAGGVESMSRAPFVMPKADSASAASTPCRTRRSAGALLIRRSSTSSVPTRCPKPPSMSPPSSASRARIRTSSPPKASVARRQRKP